MTMMVRPVVFDSERGQLLDILERNLKYLPHARRFDWLYRDNPAGLAWSWFAYEKETGKIVGSASVFPRAMWMGDVVKLCGQVGDFAIDTSHRSLGPALMLQRATFEPVQRGILAFCYDCPPHDRGMSTFRRLGIEASCQLYRYARLLKTDRQIAKYLGCGKLAAGASALGNYLLALRPLQNPPVSGIEIAQHGGCFGEEFSILDRRVGGKNGIRSRRTAEDLNWRYRENPLQQYQVLTARRRGELVGFLVLSKADQDVSVVDLFGSSLPEVGPPLLEAVIEQVKYGPFQTLQALVPNKSGLSAFFECTYFSYRAPAERVVAYARPGSEARALLDEPRSWFLSYTDIMA